MAVQALREQIASMRQSFFDEGNLNEQYTEMEALQDDDNPNFIEETITMFFRDSTSILAKVEQDLEKPEQDFVMLERSLHRFKGSTCTIGACKLYMECNKTREYLKERDVEKAKATFRLLRANHAAMNNKFATYFQLIRQVNTLMGII